VGAGTLTAADQFSQVTGSYATALEGHSLTVETGLGVFWSIDAIEPYMDSSAAVDHLNGVAVQDALNSSGDKLTTCPLSRVSGGRLGEDSNQTSDEGLDQALHGLAQRKLADRRAQMRTLKIAKAAIGRLHHERRA
jgi:hypothetical protein